MSLGLDLILLLESITRMDCKNLNKGQVNNFVAQLESWEYAFIFECFARLASKPGFAKGLEYLNLMKDIQKIRLQHGFGKGVTHPFFGGPYLTGELEITRERIDYHVGALRCRGIIWDNVKRCLGEEEIIKRINIKAKEVKGFHKGWHEKIGYGVRFNSDMFLVNGTTEQPPFCWDPMWQRKNIKFEFHTYYDKCDFEISVIDWIMEDVLYEFCDDYMGEGHFSNNEDRLDWFKHRVNDVKLLQDKLISSAQELQMIRLAQKYGIIHNCKN